MLASRAALGDDSALRQVLERVTPKIRAMAWHMTYDREISRDLAQEALLKVVSATTLDRYRGEGPLDAFLMRVATRAMISAARSSRIRSWWGMESLDAIEERGHAAPAHVQERLSIDPGLRAAMEALPERARTIVLLVCVGEYSYEEVADALGMPLGTVKSAYSRARATLRNVLADQRIDLLTAS